MCVFSEARQRKSPSLCLPWQPHYPISPSLSLSSQPLESLMHYVVMIIT